MSHWVVGLNQLLMGDFERALRAVGEARALGEAAGERRLECYAAWVTGWAHGLRGEWEAAIVAGREAIARSARSRRATRSPALSSSSESSHTREERETLPARISRKPMLCSRLSASRISPNTPQSWRTNSGSNSSEKSLEPLKGRLPRPRHHDSGAAPRTPGRKRRRTVGYTASALGPQAT